jgi:hypothetical protein
MFGPLVFQLDINVRSAYSERHVPQIQFLSLESPPGPSADNLLVRYLSYGLIHKLRQLVCSKERKSIMFLH